MKQMKLTILITLVIVISLISALLIVEIIETVSTENKLEAKRLTIISEPIAQAQYKEMVEEEAWQEAEKIEEEDLIMIVEEATKPKDIVYLEELPLSEDLQEFCQRVCKDYHVSYGILLAFMESESTFREDIGTEQVIGGDSENPSYGYMQIAKVNEEYFMRHYGCDIHTVTGNIEAGAIMLSQLMDRYGDLDMVTMAYKGGEGAAQKWQEEGFRLGACDYIQDRAWYWNKQIELQKEKN